MGILERILTRKKSELVELGLRTLPAPPERRAVQLRPESGRLALIAEIKRRSPSAGALSTKLGVAERARAYADAGADMVSVLCDTAFFDGAFEHLVDARRACPLPLLCKEFVIDERQLVAARAYGADAVLVIVRCLQPSRVGELVEAARELDLVPFVEVASEDEARVALDAGADLIGVNARDLDTLAMHPERAARVLAGLPDSVTRVHLSGLSTPDDVRRVRASPAHAALIGETLMRQDDPKPLLEGLVAAAGAA